VAKPELHIEVEDYLYIKGAVNKAGFREVGGLGIIVMEDGQPVVRHMRLLKQTISSGEVDWADDAHPEYLTWLYTSVEDGGAGFDGESYGLYSWHSHGSMNVFWSGTDEDFIRRVGLTVPYVFSSVFNNKNEVKHRLDVWSEIDCEMLGEKPRQQITWQHDMVSLSIIAHADAQPIAEEALEKELQVEAEIGKIEAALEEQAKAAKELIDAKKKELEDELKPLHLALKEIHKKVADDVQVRMKEDFDLFVTFFQPTASGQAHRPGTSSTSGKGTTNGSDPKVAGTGAPGSQSVPAHTSPAAKPNGKQEGKGKGKKGKGKESSATETKVSEGTVEGSEFLGQDPDFYKKENNWREKLFFRAYDSTAQSTSVFSLKQILEDEDIVIIQEIPDGVIGRLDPDERMTIDLRKRYQDYLSDVIARNRGHAYRGGYA
jgi:hypothetical protein